MLHLHARAALHIPQRLADADHQALQVLGRVAVLELLVELPQRREQGAVVLEVLEEGRVGGHLVVHLGADAQTRLVRPQARDVAGRVAAPAEHEGGQVELLHEGQARAVRLDAKVEAAQPVAAEGVGSALQHDGRGLVGRDGGADDVGEQARVLVVLDAVVQGHVEGVVRARVGGVGRARAVEGPRAGEEGLLVPEVRRMYARARSVGV